MGLEEAKKVRGELMRERTVFREVYENSFREYYLWWEKYLLDIKSELASHIYLLAVGIYIHRYGHFRVDKMETGSNQHRRMCWLEIYRRFIGCIYSHIVTMCRSALLLSWWTWPHLCFVENRREGMKLSGFDLEHGNLHWCYQGNEDVHGLDFWCFDESRREEIAAQCWMEPPMPSHAAPPAAPNHRTNLDFSKNRVRALSHITWRHIAKTPLQQKFSSQHVDTV